MRVLRGTGVPLCLFLLTLPIMRAATFGRSIALPGGASDIVLDERRNQIYLPQPLQNQVQVFSLARNSFSTPITTDATPLSAALSRDGNVLYVACYDDTSIETINLTTLAIVARTKLPARPEAVAVASDGRVLITTVGATGTNTLLLYNPTTNAVISITSVPPAANPPTLPPPSGRPFLAARSQLAATRDGKTIVGVNAPNGNPVAFVFESASGTVLRSRVIAGSSTTMSVSDDGTRFMAGVNLFDTATMQVLAQQNLQNAPFPVTPGTNFNVQAAQGGSVFAPDNQTLYAAFDVAPVGGPPNSAQLLLNDPDNLLIRMGIQLPENLAGKMVISADGSNAYALSDLGFMVLPMGTISRSPLAVPASNVVLLLRDPCGVTASISNGVLNINNPGQGRVTANATLFPFNGASAALAAAVRSVNTPAGPQLTFTANAALSRALGTIVPPADFSIISPEAINIPDKIRVFQNSRESESRGTIVPLPIGNANGEAFPDLIYDQPRQRLYIANPGLNRVEVYDIKSQRLLAPIKVGQLPISMVLTSDGATLYVANSGGETISVVDPDLLRSTGTIVFPPVPFNSNIAVATPVLISSALSGVQFLMSNGTLWKIVGNQAVPRAGSRVIGTNAAGQTIIGTPTAATMTATPGGEYILLATIGAGGATAAYLYDAVADDFIVNRTVPATPGYFGPIVAGPRGQFFYVGGTLLNQSLVPVRNSIGLVSGAALVGNTTYAVFNAPPVTAANAVPTTLPTIQIVDANTGLPTLTTTPLEGPLVAVAANARASIKGRNMAVDQAAGFAFAITASGLSIVPLNAPPVSARPQPNTRGIVNLASYTQSFAPNTLISIFGLNLAPNAVANAAPLPTTLANTCVTLNGTPIPLFMTSPGQINAQIPSNQALGSFPLVIHNLSNQTASATQSITVAKYAPAPLVTSDGQVSLFHNDGQYVTKDNPAVRDEYLTMYAIGLGATHGGPVATGLLSPTSPLAVTDEVKVFFGDPNFKQSEVIVDWSGLTPGLVGVYQLNLRVPGFHGSGEELPVTLRMGTINSSTTGPLPPKVAVD